MPGSNAFSSDTLHINVRISQRGRSRIGPKHAAPRTKPRIRSGSGEVRADAEREVAAGLPQDPQGRRPALAGLPDAERSAIRQAYFGGKTYWEVAVEVGVAEDTIAARLCSGLHRMSDSLRPEVVDEDPNASR